MADPNPPLAAEVLDVIPLVMRVIRKTLRARRDPDLTLPEFRSLGFINRNPGCALNELAEHIGLEAPSASKLVENLVRRGLVKRVSHPGDRRRIQLSVSAKGSKSMEIAYAQTREFLGQQLAGLNKDEQESLLHSMAILKKAFGEPVSQIR